MRRFRGVIGFCANCGIIGRYNRRTPTNPDRRSPASMAPSMPGLSRDTRSGCSDQEAHENGTVVNHGIGKSVCFQDGSKPRGASRLIPSHSSPAAGPIGRTPAAPDRATDPRSAALPGSGRAAA